MSLYDLPQFNFKGVNFYKPKLGAKKTKKKGIWQMIVIFASYPKLGIVLLPQCALAK